MSPTPPPPRMPALLNSLPAQKARKKLSPYKLLAMAAFALLLVILIAISSQVHSLLVPRPDDKHTHKSAVAEFALVDKARKDPWDGGDRKIMVSLFMPVPAGSCGGDCERNYMPPETAAISNQQFFNNKTKGVFDKIKYTTCCSARQSIDAARIPIVVLEPQTDTSRLIYSNLARYITANNAAVLLIDHPHDSSVVEFPASEKTLYNSGSTALSSLSPLTEWNATVTSAIDMRIQDITFALFNLSTTALASKFPTFKFTSTLDTSHFGIIGHGLGGTVASHLSFTDSRVKWSINLSGSAPPLDRNTKTPTYFIGRADLTRDEDVNWPKTWKHLTGPATEYNLANATITDFSDLPVVIEASGVNELPRGPEGAWPNHALRCFVEGIVMKEEWGSADVTQGCIRMFAEKGRVVPYMAKGGVIEEGPGTESGSGNLGMEGWWWLLGVVVVGVWGVV